MRLPRRAPRLAAALVAASLAFGYVQWWDLVIPRPGAQPYQAVFLANGQAYFGRYHDRLGPYAKLEGPYYLQQGTPAEQGAAAPEPRLVRRGSELHRPETRVLIQKSAILFVEDLQTGSPIARFIDEDSRR